MLKQYEDVQLVITLPVSHWIHLRHRQANVCGHSKEADPLEDLLPGAYALGAKGEGAAGDIRHPIGEQPVLHDGAKRSHDGHLWQDDAEARQECEADRELKEVLYL
eukprot:CAMPEP_0197904778 /NCGR_PEP_ID=MMETSP1439-20131203/58769_1 /TAXON_ID=66791 /ORGANISM="Gonyaulax spinifera, Strain CCMP409" /LENGTH=105 /DNA_ID=CAMNT_0043525993 /DNA_START=250 /DNA_END=567 /DNA_ORIENTATION=+